MILKYSLPKIKIIYTSVEGDIYELNENISGEILSVKTNKSLNQVSGDFNIIFVARNNLQRIFKSYNEAKVPSGKTTAMTIFRPGGLIDIYINDKEIMIGLIDTIQRTKSVSDTGQPNFIFTITGRDLGCFMEDHRIWYEKNPKELENRQNVSVLGGYIFLEELSGKTGVLDLVTGVYDTFFKKIMNSNGNGNAEPFKFVDGKSIEEKLIVKKFSEGGGLSNKVYISDYLLNFETWSKEATIWDFLKSFSSLPFNEMYFDTGGDNIVLSNSEKINLASKKGYLIFRPSPFDDENIGVEKTSNLKISEIEEIKIDDSMIKQEFLQRSRTGCYSTYRIFPFTSMIPVSQSGYFTDPIYDKRSLRRYGYKEYHAELEGLDGGESGLPSNFKEIGDTYSAKLYSWYRNNDLYLNGNITVKGNEKIKVGKRLKYESKDQDIDGYGYITGVEHDFNYSNNSFETKISVERYVVNSLISDFKNKDRK